MFWRLTPGHMQRIAEAAVQARNEQMAIVRWGIWHLAALPRAKTFPAFDAFVGSGAGADDPAARERAFYEKAKALADRMARE